MTVHLLDKDLSDIFTCQHAYLVQRLTYPLIYHFSVTFTATKLGSPVRKLFYYGKSDILRDSMRMLILTGSREIRNKTSSAWVRRWN